MANGKYVIKHALTVQHTTVTFIIIFEVFTLFPECDDAYVKKTFF